MHRREIRTATAGRQATSREDLLRLLSRLGPDHDSAWQEYTKLKQKLILFFDQCSEAEELAEEVLDRIARKQDSYGIINIAQFAFGVARNLRQETRRKYAARVSVHNDEDYPIGELNPESTLIDAIDSGKRRDCFLHCLQRLSPEDRRMVFEYFPADDEDPEKRRQSLSEKSGLSAGALRTKMARLREKLENCCEHCVAQKHKNQKWKLL